MLVYYTVKHDIGNCNLGSNMTSRGISCCLDSGLLSSVGIQITARQFELVMNMIHTHVCTVLLCLANFCVQFEKRCS